MKTLLHKALELGAYKAAVVNVKEVPFDRRFRDLCAANACGNYGKNHMCPPDAGDIDELITRAQCFDKMLVYQTVSELEDSYDFEGMMEAGRRHNELAQRLREETDTQTGAEVLHLGAGGCRVCAVCAKREDLPCRHPEQAMASLETYGIAVSELAALAGMNYINGSDTVTYFGSVLYKEV